MAAHHVRPTSRAHDKTAGRGPCGRFTYAVVLASDDPHISMAHKMASCGRNACNLTLTLTPPTARAAGAGGERFWAALVSHCSEPAQLDIFQGTSCPCGGKAIAGIPRDRSNSSRQALEKTGCHARPVKTIPNCFMAGSCSATSREADTSAGYDTRNHHTHGCPGVKQSSTCEHRRSSGAGERPVRLYENPSSHVSKAAQQHKLAISPSCLVAACLCRPCSDEFNGNTYGGDTRHEPSTTQACGQPALTVQAEQGQALPTRPACSERCGILGVDSTGEPSARLETIAKTRANNLPACGCTGAAADDLGSPSRRLCQLWLSHGEIKISATSTGVEAADRSFVCASPCSIAFRLQLPHSPSSVQPRSLMPGGVARPCFAPAKMTFLFAASSISGTN